MVIGVLLGMISGYVGGIVDAVIMRLADVVLSFPSLLLAMVIMYTLGDGITSIFIALAITSWAGVARVIRSETLTLRETEYVEAARSMGVKDFYDHSAPCISELYSVPDCFVYTGCAVGHPFRECA